MRGRGNAEYRAREPSFPISLRLTASERARLETEACGANLSAYIRQRLFDDPAPRRKVRMPRGDEQRLAQILALLGQSGIAENLLELAYSAKIGALILTKDNEESLLSACAAVQAIRADLIAALDLNEARS